MANIRLDFSKEGWASKTPNFIKIIYRIVIAISGIWVMVVSPNLSDYLSEHIRLIISSIIGSLSSSMYFICNFFHYKDSNIDQNGTNNTE